MLPVVVVVVVMVHSYPPALPMLVMMVPHPLADPVAVPIISESNEYADVRLRLGFSGCRSTRQPKPNRCRNNYGEGCLEHGATYHSEKAQIGI
jgi:hypothetical protein